MSVPGTVPSGRFSARAWYDTPSSRKLKSLKPERYMFRRDAACRRLVDRVFVVAGSRVRKILKVFRFPKQHELLLVGGIAAFQHSISSQQSDPRMLIVITVLFAESIFIGFLIAERLKRRIIQAERDMAHAALQESEEKNRAILSALPDLMFLMDENGTYLDCHAADVNGLYVPPERFLGRKMREVMPPDLAELFEEHLRKVSISGLPSAVEYSMVVNNKPNYFEARIVKCGQSKLLSIVRDVTEKKHAETEFQQLSSRLLSLQDDERRRIARELHDGTAQNLFAITVNLQNLQNVKVGLTSSGLELVKECEELCEESLREVRTLSYVIHPPGLDRVGLIPTLRWYIDGFTRRSGIDVKLCADQSWGRLPLDVEIDLFRIVQEGLSNVFRHSGSPVASVVLERRIDEAVLKITDSGHGMLRENANSYRTERFGVGIPSMRERVRRLGGNLDIKSAADGVVIVARVPVPAERELSETRPS
jgi:PAS domain S-box-containing protein